MPVLQEALFDLSWGLLNPEHTLGLFTALAGAFSKLLSHRGQKIPRGLHLGAHSILSAHYVLQIPALGAEVEAFPKGREANS